MKRSLERPSTSFQYNQTKQPKVTSIQLPRAALHFNEGRIIFNDDIEDGEIIPEIPSIPAIKALGIDYKVRKPVQVKIGDSVTTKENIEIVKCYQEQCKNLNLVLKVLKQQLQDSYVQKMEIKKRLDEECEKMLTKEKEKEELIVVNRQLQHCLIKKIKPFAEVIPSHNIPLNEEQNSDPYPGQYSLDRLKIHIGRDIWIPTEKYHDFSTGITIKKLPKFIRKVALHLFGRETLLKSTVSGHGSNRSKVSMRQQKALDPVKLLAMRDFFSFMLRDKLGYKRNDADLEAANTFKYIMKYIAELKTPRNREKERRKVQMSRAARKGKRKVVKKVVNDETEDEESKDETEEVSKNGRKETSKDGVEEVSKDGTEEVSKDGMDEVSKDGMEEEEEGSKDGLEDEISNDQVENGFLNDNLDEEFSTDKIKEELDCDLKDMVGYDPKDSMVFDLKEENEYDIKEEIEYINEEIEYDIIEL